MRIRVPRLSDAIFLAQKEEGWVALLFDIEGIAAMWGYGDEPHYFKNKEEGERDVRVAFKRMQKGWAA